jgi:hypothetical protein
MKKTIFNVTLGRKVLIDQHNSNNKTATTQHQQQNSNRTTSTTQKQQQLQRQHQINSKRATTQ